MSKSGVVPVGVFYDGNYFQHVSRYYAFDHPVRSRLSMEGLHSFIACRVAAEEGVAESRCKVTEAHYFSGKLWSDEAARKDCLESERKTEDYLMKAGVTPHSLPLREGAEKGVDVLFALEAYERASKGSFAVAALLTGDGDYLPLVRKLSALGVRTLLLGWNLPDGQRNSPLYVSRRLSKEATYSPDMANEMDDLLAEESTLAASIFPSMEILPFRRDSADSPIGPSSDLARDAEKETFRFSLEENGGVKEVGAYYPASVEVSNGNGQRSAEHHAEYPVANAESGTVDYLHDNGYGFLRPHRSPERSERLFFFQSDVVNESFDNLQHQQRVTFRRSMNERGPCAVEVMT